MPTQSEASPWLLLGALGRTRVEVASRIHEPSATGPVLKAGPIAASATEERATAAKAEMIWREEGILVVVRVFVWLISASRRRAQLHFCTRSRPDQLLISYGNQLAICRQTRCGALRLAVSQACNSASPETCFEEWFRLGLMRRKSLPNTSIEALAWQMRR